jgi:hypothetical protein
MNTDPATTMRRSRLARARMIRRRIVGGAVALFVATWLLIAIVLVSGHDPALAAHRATTTAGANSATAASTTATTTATPATTSVGSVTTRQS